MNLTEGRIEDAATGRTYRSEPFPEFLQQIIAAGGLVAYTKARLGAT